VVNNYGLSETTVVATSDRSNRRRGSASIGRPSRVLARWSRAPATVEAGGVGELMIGGGVGAATQRGFSRRALSWTTTRCVVPHGAGAPAPEVRSISRRLRTIEHPGFGSSRRSHRRLDSPPSRRAWWSASAARAWTIRSCYVVAAGNADHCRQGRPDGDELDEFLAASFPSTLPWRYVWSMSTLSHARSTGRRCRTCRDCRHRTVGWRHHRWRHRDIVDGREKTTET